MASKGQEPKVVQVPKTLSELQKIRLNKLMSNPTKEAFIPDASKANTQREPPEFIRNVWGSSAGAGSGDFHVYRGVRRREYARQKFITEKAVKDQADSEYHKKVQENQKVADEKTSKKRAKRLKKKQKKNTKKQKKEEVQEASDSDDEEDADVTGADPSSEKTKTVSENENHSDASSKDSTNDSSPRDR